jgi:hypothetical protein
MEEGDVTHFVKLIHSIIEEFLGHLLFIHHDPRRSIVKVGWEDCLGTIDREEGRVARRLAWGHPQAAQNRREFRDPLSPKLVELVEDPRLDALQYHAIHASNLSVRAGVHHGSPIDTDVVVIAEP